LLEYSKLCELGKFEKYFHSKVELSKGRKCITKSSGGDDSNNVFINRLISKGEAYVECLVKAAYDEMAFGVTACPSVIRRTNAWANVGNPHEYVYNYRERYYGMISFGKTKVRGTNTFKVGDKVAVYVNADKLQVSWYKNGRFVATNLPENPLPPSTEGYGIWVMVDYTNDEVLITDFGYYQPYPDLEVDVAAWKRWVNPI